MSFPRFLLAAASIALGIGTSACSSNANAPAIPGAAAPATTVARASGERILGTLVVRPSDAVAVASDVLLAAPPHYYYGPRGGANAVAPTANRKNLKYHGGPVVLRETAYDLYVNCPDGSCWGNPGDFSVRFGESNYAHVADQYMRPKKVTAHGRYTYTGGISIEIAKKNLTEKDLFAMLHQSARTYGGGLGKLYHVFLKSDTGLCKQGPQCKIDYCAYHSTVIFKDVGPVDYSVEPYQKGSCLSPNKKLRDSTDTTLLHEIFEAITDPMVNLDNKEAWYNYNLVPGSQDNYGEIADICDGQYGYPELGNYREQIQKVWSNERETCTYQP